MEGKYEEPQMGVAVTAEVHCPVAYWGHGFINLTLGIIWELMTPRDCLTLGEREKANTTKSFCSLMHLGGSLCLCLCLISIHLFRTGMKVNSLSWIILLQTYGLQTWLPGRKKS